MTRSGYAGGSSGGRRTQWYRWRRRRRQPVVIWSLATIVPFSPLPLLSVITVEPTGSFIS